MADAELETHVRLRRVLEAWVFDLAGNLIYTNRELVSEVDVFVFWLEVCVVLCWGVLGQEFIKWLSVTPGTADRLWGWEPLELREGKGC
jgi:hypothetical protein